jgi:hypothetical protein
MMQSSRDHVSMTSATTAITLRSASAADQAALADLASLDSRRLREGSYLVAEDAGRLLAAMSERDGSVIADPFRLTAETVELLRRRREQLLVARSHGTRRSRSRLFTRHTASRVA